MTALGDIYVDADACPVKGEVYKVAERHGLRVHVVTNGGVTVPRDPRIRLVVVGADLDATRGAGGDDHSQDGYRRG